MVSNVAAKVHVMLAQKNLYTAGATWCFWPGHIRLNSEDQSACVSTPSLQTYVPVHEKWMRIHVDYQRLFSRLTLTCWAE